MYLRIFPHKLRASPWGASGLMRARKCSLESDPKFKYIRSVCHCFYMSLVARSHLTIVSIFDRIEGMHSCNLINEWREIKSCTQHPFAIELTCDWSAQARTHFCGCTVAKKMRSCRNQTSPCYRLRFTRFLKVSGNKVDALGVPTLNVSNVFWTLCEDVG